MKTREIICAAISIIALLILFPLTDWFARNTPWQVYRLLSGFLLGSVGALSFAVTVDLFNKYRRGGIAAIESSAWLRPFSLVFYGIIILFGRLVWYASWEGQRTGIFYGFGVFVGASLMEAGVGAILKNEAQRQPPPKTRGK